jgi:hypothetical protein
MRDDPPSPRLWRPGVDRRPTADPPSTVSPPRRALRGHRRDEIAGNVQYRTPAEQKCGSGCNFLHPQRFPQLRTPFFAFFFARGGQGSRLQHCGFQARRPQSDFFVRALEVPLLSSVFSQNRWSESGAEIVAKEPDVAIRDPRSGNNS